MVRSRVPRKILGVIPARYASSRFPGKALARIDSRTMLEHVHERVAMSRYITSVIVATDVTVDPRWPRLARAARSHPVRSVLSLDQWRQLVRRWDEVQRKKPSDTQVPPE